MKIKEELKRSKKHVKEISQICRKREKAQKGSACRMQMQAACNKVHVLAPDYVHLGP